MSKKEKSSEFKEKTKIKLAERAGYICSNSDCKMRTAGAHTEDDKSVKIREAAHIKGARDRDQPDMMKK